jgi:apolipoprotein N-acyltransferase
MAKSGAVNEQGRPKMSSLVRAAAPTRAEASLLIGSALLTVLSFPNFDLWFLAWLSLAPLLVVIIRAKTPARAFVGAWLWGVLFFYGSCWWLTYPMIRYGQISKWLAYPLFLLPIALVAFFPGLFGAFLSRVIQRFGFLAIVVAPLIWVSVEWLRYTVTGQLWNALGYSQAFHPLFIQSARTGGVYAVSFLLVAINGAIASLLLRKWKVALAVSIGTIGLAILFSYGSRPFPPIKSNEPAAAIVVATQPNVPMDLSGDADEMKTLLERHLTLAQTALNDLDSHKPGTYSSFGLARLVIWPESPMNFSYSRDAHLREVVGRFARSNHTSVLLNSLEPASTGGDQNSAIMVNEEGEIAARYDKIRLMPFGEYVPLPRWLPGASSVRGLVGEFKPGSSYTLMPLGALRAGVFICIEAAHPGIARDFTNEGADVLINISNDGYLGPTPVMRQHLANAIFRAVENDRALVRVTNTGITTYISPNGRNWDETSGFQTDVRTWTIGRDKKGITFYSRHGDLFVYACALISLGIISASFMRRRTAP